ncbi:MAG: hypothetical protein WBD31_24990 [Rubripirellula sp.]
MRSFCTLVFVSICLAAIADEPIKLTKPPATVEEAITRLTEETKTLDDKLAELKKSHAKKIAAFEAVAISDIKQIARTEAGAGQIAKASEAWKAVLNLDASDKEAQVYFNAIGRSDLTKKAVVKQRKSADAAQSDSQYATSWEFLGSSKQVIDYFVFYPTGKVKAQNVYFNAKWSPLDANTLMFNYGAGDDVRIIFHDVGEGMMKGYHSRAGRVRYLRRRQ